jgi:hypothetical protein
MRHGQIIQFGTCTAYQCRAGIDEGVQFPGDCSWGPGRTIQYLQESSLPVCTQGPGHGQRGSGSRTEDSFHHQIITGFSSKAQAICKFYRQEFERNRDASSGDLSPWTQLRTGSPRPGESSWNTASIVCRRGKSSRLINSLFPAKHGQRGHHDSEANTAA